MEILCVYGAGGFSCSEKHPLLPTYWYTHFNLGQQYVWIQKNLTCLLYSCTLIVYGCGNLPMFCGAMHAWHWHIHFSPQKEPPRYLFRHLCAQIKRVKLAFPLFVHMIKIWSRWCETSWLNFFSWSCACWHKPYKIWSRGKSCLFKYSRSNPPF